MNVITVTRKWSEGRPMKRCGVATVDVTVLVLIVTLLFCGCGSSGALTPMGDASQEPGDAVTEAVALPNMTDVNDLGVDVLVEIDATDVLDVAVEDLSEVGDTDAGPAPTTRASVAVGFEHTCARMMDGTVRCWGGNGAGQLGDGTTINRLAPVTTSALSSVASVAVGVAFSCAKLTDRTVWCWGRNGAGQLGDGTMTDRLTPVAVSGLSSVTELVAGGSHACALLAEGTVRCWGYNGLGQLGDGSTTNRLTPVTVTGLSSVTSISAGHSHTCARLADGTARCWGWNAPFRQLGDGTMTDQLTPVAVSGLGGFVGVAGGYHHSCARLSDGRAVCWGDNSSGMVGDGTTTTRPTPVAVMGLTNAIDVGAGFDYSCALLADRTVRCWGNNDTGCLGDGTTDGRTVPVAVTDLHDVVDLAVGPDSDHSCARVASGAILCWGGNRSGQLGDGTTTNRVMPTPIVTGALPSDAGAPMDSPPVDGSSMDSGVVCAAGSSTCPTGTSARQVCNADGRGFTSMPCVAPANATAPVCGASNACTFTCLAGFGDCDGNPTNGCEANLATDTANCGMCGNGCRVACAMGTCVTRSLAAGFSHACVRLTDGTVRCWGDNSSGQLGDGTMANRLIPVTVSGLSGVVQLAAGNFHTCARLVDGTVRCWGGNSSGEIGDGTTTTRLTPVAVTGLSGVTDLAAGSGHTCALIADGTVRCWGDNENTGTLGDGTLSARLTPVVVSGLTRVSGSLSREAPPSGGTHGRRSGMKARVLQRIAA